MLVRTQCPHPPPKGSHLQSPGAAGAFFRLTRGGTAGIVCSFESFAHLLGRLNRLATNVEDHVTWVDAESRGASRRFNAENDNAFLLGGRIGRLACEGLSNLRPNINKPP